VPAPVIAWRQDSTTVGPSHAFIDAAKPPVPFEVGDVAVLVVAMNDTDTSSVAVPLDLPGWQFIWRSGTALQKVKVAAYMRPAMAGGEPDGTDMPAVVRIDFDASALGNDRAVASYLRVTGASPTVNAIGVSAGAQSASSITVPSLTTTIDDCLVFAAAGFSGGDGSPMSVSPGWWIETDLTDNPGGSSGATLLLATRTLAGAGSSDAPVVTATRSRGWTAFQFALGPASTGTTSDAAASLVVSSVAAADVDLVAVASSGLAATATVSTATALTATASIAMAGTSSIAAATGAGGLLPEVVAASPVVTPGDGTELVLAKPGPHLVGDLAVLVVASNDGTTTQAVSTPPPGWSLVGRSGTNVANSEVGLFVRTAEPGAETDNTDLPDTVTFTAPISSRLAGWWIQLRGAGAVINSPSAASAGSVSSITLPAATSVRADSLAMAVLATRGTTWWPLNFSGGGWGAGAWPDDLTGQSLQAGGSGGTGAAWLTRPVASPSSTGDLTATLSTGTTGMTGFIVVIDPPAVATLTAPLAGSAVLSAAAAGVSDSATALAGSATLAVEAALDQPMAAAMAGGASFGALALVGTPPPAVVDWDLTLSTISDASITLTKPGAFDVGDLAVLVVHNNDQEGGFSMATPAGWNLADGAGTTGTRCEVGVMWRFAGAGAEPDGTDLPGTVTVQGVTATDDRWAGYYLRVAGAAAVGPVGQRATQNTTQTLVVPSLATTTPNCLVLVAVSTQGGNTLPWTITGDSWPGPWPDDLTGQSVGVGLAGGTGGGWVTTIAPDAGVVASPTIGTSVARGMAAVQLAISPTVPAATFEAAATLAGVATALVAAERVVTGSASITAELAAIASATDLLAVVAMSASASLACQMAGEVTAQAAVGFAADADAAALVTMPPIVAPLSVSIEVVPGDVLGAVALGIDTGTSVDAVAASAAGVLLVVQLASTVAGSRVVSSGATLPISLATSAAAEVGSDVSASLVGTSVASVFAADRVSGVVALAADVEAVAVAAVGSVADVALASTIDAEISGAVAPSGGALLQIEAAIAVAGERSSSSSSATLTTEIAATVAGAVGVASSVAASGSSGLAVGSVLSVRTSASALFGVDISAVPVRSLIGSTSVAVSAVVAVLAPVAPLASGRVPLMTVRRLVRVRPSLTDDGYGNLVADGGAGDRLEFRGWLQQQTMSESRPDGRTPKIQTWLLVTQFDDVLAGDRIEWPADHPTQAPMVFEIEGPPEPAFAGFRGLHHTEASLRLVEA
jgi:collagen type VII alpha